MKKELINVINLGRTVDNSWLPSDIISKLFEEGGEYSRAVMIKTGRLKNKIDELDADFDECADVIQCAVDLLSRINQHLSAEELLDKLAISMEKKTEKWNKQLME